MENRHDDEGMVHHEFHPSDSIPDAAYPNDSPYQPGSGSSGPSLGMPGSSAVPSPVASSGVTTMSPSSAAEHHARNPTSWVPQSVPHGPPPPYDPASAPSEYSSRVAAAALSSQRAPSLDAAAHDRRALERRPTASPAPAASPGDMIPLQILPPASSSSPPQAETAQPSTTTRRSFPAPSLASATIDEQDKTEDAAAELRERKKKHIKICFLALSFLVLFLVALSVGLALGLTSANRNRHHYRPHTISKVGPPPPPHHRSDDHFGRL